MTTEEILENADQLANKFERAGMTLEELQKSNSERLQALAKQGVTLDPVMLLKLRVDQLTAAVFGMAENGTERWTEFDTQWEETMAEIIDHAESSLARRRLLDGIG